MPVATLTQSSRACPPKRAFFASFAFATRSAFLRAYSMGSTCGGGVGGEVVWAGRGADQEGRGEVWVGSGLRLSLRTGSIGEGGGGAWRHQRTLLHVAPCRSMSLSRDPISLTPTRPPSLTLAAIFFALPLFLIGLPDG